MIFSGGGQHFSRATVRGREYSGLPDEKYVHQQNFSFTAKDKNAKFFETIFCMEIFLLLNDHKSQCHITVQLTWYNSLWLWRWLPHRLSKRQSLSTTTVLFRTMFTRMINLNLLLNLFSICKDMVLVLFLQWVFFFSSFSVDATFSKGLGRLVNDAPSNKSNSVMRKVKEGSETYLVLYALRDIKIGEELRYDYGVKDLPWCKIKGNWILAVIILKINLLWVL